MVHQGDAIAAAGYDEGAGRQMTLRIVAVKGIGRPADEAGDTNEIGLLAGVSSRVPRQLFAEPVKWAN